MNIALLKGSAVRAATKAATGLAISGAGLLMFAMPAFAGVGVGVAPDFPATVNAGQTGVSAGLEITNNSTPDVGSVNLSNIRLIPQCGDTDADQTTCVGAGEVDPGVFTVSPTATGANACAGINFTVAVNDAVTGQVLFTPSGTITLAQGAVCRINFTVDANRVPANDSSAAVGLQTLQIGKVFAIQTVGGDLTGNGLGTDQTTISKASPTVSTLLSDLGPVSAGATVHDSATISGATPTAGGSIQYIVYSDDACSIAFIGAGVKTVTNGIAPDSDGVTFNVPGTYNWQAVYSGDAANNAATSTCQTETLVVNRLSSSVTTDVHDANHGVILSAPIGATVHDKATVTGSGPTPTGTVSFSLYGNPSCTGATTTETVALAAGVAETSGTVLGASGLSYKAFYSGDATYLPSVGACEPLNATKFSPTIATVLSAIATTTGAFVNDTATLTGASATAGGSVTYSVFTNSSCTTGKRDAGTKIVTNHIVPNSDSLQFNSAGTFYWQAVYSGDAANNAATSTCTEEILTVTQPPAGQYCSPGYWKQAHHFDSYVTYSPNQTFLSVFGVNAFPGKTLVQVLSTGGGGLTAYGRATVGALLNASALSSGLTPAQVIAKFNATYAGAPSGNSNGYYGSANSEFTAPENCPLN
ncbi:MAG: hypothetical protein V4436_03445 [Patescibacteria group bacterium]